HGRIAIRRTNLLEQLDAAHDRHLEVGDDELGTLRGERLHAGAAILGQPAVVASRHENLVEDFSDLPIVVDDQDVPRAVLHATRPLRPSPRRPPPGSYPPVWRRTALRRRRGRGLPRSLPR